MRQSIGGVQSTANATKVTRVTVGFERIAGNECRDSYAWLASNALANTGRKFSVSSQPKCTISGSYRYENDLVKTDGGFVHVEDNIVCGLSYSTISREPLKIMHGVKRPVCCIDVEVCDIVKKTSDPKSDKCGFLLESQSNAVE